jgi:acetone carboxylase gamma subunit
LIYGTKIEKLEAKFIILFLLMTIYRVLLVSDNKFVEVESGKRRKTCSCGKGSKKYSEENCQLSASTEERKD